jgi:hypothetical protein
MSWNDEYHDMLESIKSAVDILTAEHFTESDRAALAAMQLAVANLAEIQRHHEWLLQAILTNTEKLIPMVDNLDTFITDMTARMATEEAGIASLRPFIQGLFDQIAAAVPALTDAQKAALDAIEAKVDSDAGTIVAAMGPATPPVPAPVA